MGTTIKGFVSKATKGNVSASAFIAAHREFLTTGKVGQVVAPIMQRLATGEVYPTPALHEITKALMDHAISADIAKGKDPAPSTTKPYTATIYNERGKVATRLNEEGEEKVMVQKFDSAHKAEEWCDRRLVNDGGPGWTALVTCNRTGRSDTVDRDLAFGRVNRTRPGAVTNSPKGNSKLSWGMKVSETRTKFSHG